MFSKVEQVAQEYCKSMRVGLVCVYGGAPKGPQIRNLKQGLQKRMFKKCQLTLDLGWLRFKKKILSKKKF
jgi:hypothetical protein